jgi:hypothetical protein
MGIIKKFKDWNETYQAKAKKNKEEKLENLRESRENLKKAAQNLKDVYSGENIKQEAQNLKDDLKDALSSKEDE